MDGCRLGTRHILQAGLTDEYYCAGALQLSSADIHHDPLLCSRDTEMNKIPFLPVRSSWPNRKIDVTAVVQRVKCYYKDKNQKN